VSFRDADAAARQLVAARFRVKLVEASLPVLQAALDGARADLDAAQASLDRSSTALQEASIYCPIDGIVLVRDTEVGDGVSSILTAGGNATQIMSLGDLSRMHVEARVDEVDLGKIKAGMPAIVSVDAHRGQTLTGHVERIAPAGSVDQNGIVTFEVRVSIDDDKGLLKPDMTSDIQLVLDRRQDVLTLPQRALKRNAKGAWIATRVVSEEPTPKLEEVEVELGLSDGLITEIVSGLSEGDRILVPVSRR
jgi:RND family efflux transporter MFP subunit